MLADIVTFNIEYLWHRTEAAPEPAVRPKAAQSAKAQEGQLKACERQFTAYAFPLWIATQPALSASPSGAASMAGPLFASPRGAPCCSSRHRSRYDTCHDLKLHPRLLRYPLPQFGHKHTKSCRSSGAHLQRHVVVAQRVRRAHVRIRIILHLVLCMLSDFSGSGQLAVVSAP